MTMTSGLHRKTRIALERQLAEGEEVVAVIPGRFKQALVATDRRLLLIKPGFMAGATAGVKITTFAFATVVGINAHVAVGGGVLEVLDASHQALEGRPGDMLRAAAELPNCLPCERATATSPAIAQLRTYVARAARAQRA